MALDKTKLDITGSGSKGTKVLAIYETADNKAAVKTDGYFDTAFKELGRVGAMLIFASDATFFAKVTLTAPTDVAIAAPETYA